MKEIKELCKTCKTHLNKPSRCTLDKEVKFVGRCNTCENWKHDGVFRPKEDKS